MKKEKNKNMETNKKSFKVWDKVWAKTEYSSKKINYDIIKTKKSIYWRRIKKEIIKSYGGIKGLKIIELGSGKGIVSFMCALKGADVTLVDYSKEALQKAKLYFRKSDVKAKYCYNNFLKLPKNFLSKYDISFSLGVAEHFSGKNRIKVIKTHLDVLKKGGTAFIIVPNKWYLPYRIHKFLSQLFNRWAFGEEYPFSIIELNQIGKKINKKFKFMGGYLFFDNFLICHRLKNLLSIKEDYNINKIRSQIGTPFDKYFSHLIIIIAKK